MRKITPNRILIQYLYVCLTISLFTTACGSNVNTLDKVKNRRSKPNMWVPKELGDSLEKNFKRQHDSLSIVIHGDETDSMFFPIASFNKVLDILFSNKNFQFLHVAIGSYDSSKDVPKGCEGKLTILFQPAVDSVDVTSPYYSISPDGTFYKDDNYLKWIHLYDSIKMPKLLANLDRNDSNNTSKKKRFSNTRFITYDTADIADLRRELIYQKDSNGVTTTGIRAFFSSYDSTGKRHSKFLKNRIFVIYEFTTIGSKKQDSVYYIDDQNNFGERADPANNNGVGLLSTENLFSVDNGHLCPPNCP